MALESGRRFIAHFDLDSFFVSVERLKDPSLIGKPVIVGGLSDRGVVAACSYETRRFGVQSAMPMKTALRLCPSARVIKGDYASYTHYSRLVTEVIGEKAPVMEKASIDEFYIDLTGMDRFFGCSQYVSELKQKIVRETGLPISYALASNKLISKVATNEVKPNGQTEVPFSQERSFLAPLLIEKLPGVGQKTAATLRAMGADTIGSLSKIPLTTLQARFGKGGIELARKANGIDDSPVTAYSERKSISKEDTFPQDTADGAFLLETLVRLTESVAFQLRRHKKLTGCVAIKLRYSNFSTVSHQAMIEYTSSDDLLLSTAKGLFAKLYDKRQAVRLLGVRLSHLIEGNQQIGLFTDTTENIRLYQALDHIRQRFGTDAVFRATGHTLNSDGKKNEE
ncbi:DNA polymerase IV [Arcticibacter sp. MXS-1]|uniref:DNA polymerase IV n=1 Tax=Arcticibacter sp. MXS-1 TaxID=3341726 RepID=UPI0035A89370